MLLTFPRGASGIGLLTLRVTVAVAVIILGSGELSGGPFKVIAIAAIGLAVLIAVGLFTHSLSAIVAILLVALFFVFPTGLIIKTTLAALCVSISMMGAGAYSIDGLLHGRRRIIVLKASRPYQFLNKPPAKG